MQSEGKVARGTRGGYVVWERRSFAVSNTKSCLHAAWKKVRRASEPPNSPSGYNPFALTFACTVSFLYGCTPQGSRLVQKSTPSPREHPFREVLATLMRTKRDSRGTIGHDGQATKQNQAANIQLACCLQDAQFRAFA